MLIRSRRPKRNRYLQIGLFFIIYTCYHAYSAAVVKREVTDDGTTESLQMSEMFTTTENVPEVTHVEVRNEKSIFHDIIFKPLQDVTESATATQATYHGHPTWRPRRENCTPPAIEQFPPPLMSKGWRTVSSAFTPQLFDFNELDCSTVASSSTYWWRFSLSWDWRSFATIISCRA